MKPTVKRGIIYSTTLRVKIQAGLALALTLLFSHCGPFLQRDGQRDPPIPLTTPRSESDSKLAAQPADATNAGLSRLLRNHYQVWKGVPYRLGGFSKSGVDCSGFVLLTFKKHFGLRLPRSTLAQVHAGRAVPRSALRTGDLVFFKTGFLTTHVGIYLNETQFLHASTSQGVTISPLNTGYWHEHYWQSRRILSL